MDVFLFHSPTLLPKRSCKEVEVVKERSDSELVTVREEYPLTGSADLLRLKIRILRFFLHAM